MEEKDKTYTLEEVTYFYLVDKVHDTNYKNIPFEVFKSENNGMHSSINEAQRTDFINKVKTFSDNLLKIENYLGIKDLIAKSKNQKTGYTFTWEDVNFLKELMYKFTLKKTDLKGEKLVDDKEDLVRVWSDIRKVINKWDKTKYIKEHYRDPFVEIYRNNSGEVVYSEINFILNGFLAYIERQNECNTDLYDECEMELKKNTSIVKIRWLWEMDKLIYSALPLSWEEIVEAKPGVLLNDYQESLTNLTAKIAEIIKAENMKWDNTKKARMCEFQESYLNEEGQRSLRLFKEKLKEIDPNLGGELCDDIENDTVESSGGKNYEKKRKIFMRALEALDPKERINVCEMLLDIDEK